MLCANHGFHWLSDLCLTLAKRELRGRFLAIEGLAFTYQNSLDGKSASRGCNPHDGAAGGFAL
jgi:hypothetical protein